MSNIINKLTEQNQENYEQYFERMTSSFNHSSKSLIPLFVKGDKVLDVGCGSGVLIEELLKYNFNVEGLDISTKAVELCREKGLTVHNTPLNELTYTYDTIIFSSVLHEFSSYSPSYRYSNIPIKDALKIAYNRLNDNGRIIIRDGIKADENITSIRFKNPKIIKSLKQYCKDAPMFRDNFIFDKNIKVNDNNCMIGYSVLLKEFMYTYTWGPNSYNREVLEQYGILTIREWIDLVKSIGFNIQKVVISADEYIKYLSKDFIEDDNLHNLFDKSTILIVASK